MFACLLQLSRIPSHQRRLVFVCVANNLWCGRSHYHRSCNNMVDKNLSLATNASDKYRRSCRRGYGPDVLDFWIEFGHLFYL
jgi:hypothetical protein